MANNKVLPVYEILDDVKSALAESNYVVVQAAPGAGKSTIIPIELLTEPWLKYNKIIMLEPRRLAAKAVSRRMAELKNSQLEDLIGYRIRHETLISPKTRLEVVTEGILTRMLQSDPTLEGVGLIIFDEFHERSLHADLALAFTRQIVELLRPDLRVLIMSATLNTAEIAVQLGNATVISCEGRSYPVTIQYAKPAIDEPLHKIMTSELKKALQSTTGDILAFLPGVGEIQRTAAELESAVSASIYTLYGDLSPQEQQRAILPDPSGRRKIILSTSIAETSLTIEGVTTVVDSGLSRKQEFDLSTGMNKTVTRRSARDTVDQRAGRAGRLGPGKAIRLWGSLEDQHLPEHSIPEILEADLTSLVLETANWGVSAISDLKWISLPPTPSFEYAKDILNKLEALDGFRITKIGKRMLEIPAHPRLAHMLIKSLDDKILDTAILITALLEERDFIECNTDIDLRLAVLTGQTTHQGVKRHALEKVKKQVLTWQKFFRIKQITDFDPKQTGRLLSLAYPERIAMNEGNGKFRLANGRVAVIDIHDPLAKEKFIVAAVVTFSGKEARIRLAAPIQENEIQHLAETEERVEWDFQRNEFVAQQLEKVGSLILTRTPLKSISADKKVEVLAEVLKKIGVRILNWTDEAEAFQARVSSLQAWGQPDIPEISDDNIIASSADWLPYYADKIRALDDFKKISALEIMRNLLDWDQQQLIDKLAPESMTVPSGSQIKLQYFANGQQPVLAVRLQELFGMTDTPAVNNGQIKVLIHLLSPGYKPVQVTSDLRSFWQNTYPQVKKELKIRYPKHSWPDDPLTAEAVRGVRKKL
jgi:ATP-dependent helicase HrpB